MNVDIAPTLTAHYTRPLVDEPWPQLNIAWHNNQRPDSFLISAEYFEDLIEELNMWRSAYSHETTPIVRCAVKARHT